MTYTTAEYEKARRELQKTVASDLQKTVANAVGRLERKLGSPRQEEKR